MEGFRMTTTRRDTGVTGLKCLHCSAPSTNGTVLCKKCLTTVEHALANVGAYHADLLGLGAEVVRIRSRGGVSDPTGTAASRADARPPADAPDFAAAETKSMLVTWTRVLIDDRPQLAYPHDTVKSLTGFLARHLRTIATLEWADELARDSLTYEQRLRRIIERSKGRWYAGVCAAELEAARVHDSRSCICACHLGADRACDIEGGCGREYPTIPAVYCSRGLYAQPGSTYVKCPECGAQWRVSERRHILLEEARETLLPVSVIARAALTLLDDEPSLAKLDARLRQWVKRGELEDYGVRVILGQPRRVYRLGDVIDTLTRQASRTRA